MPKCHLCMSEPYRMPCANCLGLSQRSASPFHLRKSDSSMQVLTLPLQVPTHALMSRLDQAGPVKDRPANRTFEDWVSAQLLSHACAVRSRESDASCLLSGQVESACKQKRVERNVLTLELTQLGDEREMDKIFHLLKDSQSVSPASTSSGCCVRDLGVAFAFVCVSVRDYWYRLSFFPCSVPTHSRFLCWLCWWWS